jgi:hypothetical protein
MSGHRSDKERFDDFSQLMADGWQRSKWLWYVIVGGWLILWLFSSHR